MTRHRGQLTLQTNGLQTSFELVDLRSGFETIRLGAHEWAGANIFQETLWSASQQGSYDTRDVSVRSLDNRVAPASCVAYR